MLIHGYEHLSLEYAVLWDISMDFVWAVELFGPFFEFACVYPVLSFSLSRFFLCLCCHQSPKRGRESGGVGVRGWVELERELVVIRTLILCITFGVSSWICTFVSWVCRALRHIYGFHLSRWALWSFFRVCLCLSCFIFLALSCFMFVLSSITKKGEIVSI